MLITLQSNSDADASDFTNYFKQTVTIPANSEVALHNICYKFENSFVILVGVNDEYTIRFADDTVDITFTVVAGSYSPDEFIDALNASIVAGLATAPYKIRRLFPASGLVWAFTSSSKNQIKLTIVYDPQAWESLKVLNAPDTSVVRQQATLDAMDINLGGEGNIVASGVGGTGWGVRVFDSRDSLGVKHYLWGTSEDLAGSPHGSFIFHIGQVNKQCSVGIYDQEDTPSTWYVSGGNSNLSAGFRFLNSGKFRLSERNLAGTWENVDPAGVDFSFNDKFEIRVDRLSTTTPGTVRYFHNDLELTTFDAGAERFQYLQTTKFGCGGSINEKTIEEKIINATPATFTTSSVDAPSSTITLAGTGYLDQEKATLAGAGASVEVFLEVDAGAITGFSVIEENSTGFVNAELCTVTGSASGATNGRITVDVKQSMTITTPSTGYTANVAELHEIGTGNKVADINIISVGAGGEIQDFTITALNATYNFNLDGDTLDVVQGATTGGDVEVQATWSEFPSLQGVRWTTTSFGDEPLKEDTDSDFATSQASFRDITGMPPSSVSDDKTHTITGLAGIGTDRETCTMLVNLDQLEIQSICKEGGIQKAIGSVPYGAVAPSLDPASSDPVKVDGIFYHEPYNLTYHKLANAQPVNHNEFRIRLTDAVGNPIAQLKHPTTLSVDIRPKTM